MTIRTALPARGDADIAVVRRTTLSKIVSILAGKGFPARGRFSIVAVIGRPALCATYPPRLPACPRTLENLT